MEVKNIAILSGAIIGVGALAFYGKKQYDIIMNDVYYDYDPNSIRVVKANIDEVKLSMDFIIDNRSSESFDVKKLKLDILTGRKHITEIDRANEIRVIANAKTPINITLSFSPKALLKDNQGINLLNWKEIPLTFDGSIRVKRMGVWLPIPFKFTYQIKDFI